MKLKTHKKTYRRHPHSVSLLYAHLIISTKYRRRVLTQNVFTIIRKSIETKAKKMGLCLEAIEADGNHIHLLFCYPPTLSLSQIAQHIKGYSSYIIRNHRIPSVKKQLWGKAFWSKSYFVISCGGAPLDIIKAYVDNQQSPQKRPHHINTTPSQNYNEKKKGGLAAYVHNAHNKKKPYIRHLKEAGLRFDPLKVEFSEQFAQPAPSGDGHAQEDFSLFIRLKGSARSHFKRPTGTFIAFGEPVRTSLSSYK